MNGDGFGSPPWGPAEPVPELKETQALPGLGSAPGHGEQSGSSQNGHRRDNGYRDAFRPSTSKNATEADGSTPGGQATSEAGPSATRRNGHEPETAGPDEEAEPEENPPGRGRHSKRGKRRRSFWRELPVLIVIALVLALVIKAFVVQAFWIPSGSMQNTLAINDRVLVNKVVYHLRSIHRGDIAVFDGTGSWDFNNPPGSSNIFSKAVDELEGLVGVSHDSSIYIKRVIGLPGDHVVCCNSAGQVTVNGVPLSESDYLYPNNKPSANKFSITVSAGNLWVMGDHRQISDDSRGHMGDPGGGSIPVSGVIGRAFVVIWPPSHWGFLNIPATFEQPQLNASTGAGGNAAAGGSSAALAAAMANGTPVQQAASPVPLALGFLGAVPITWLQRRLRTRRRAPRQGKQ
jgi:signal peptidase I